MTQVNYSTQFVVASTGEILTISQIMASDKTISIPVGIGAEGMRNSGFIMVRPTDRPSGDVVVQDVPVLNADGYYDQAWSVREYTSEEKAARFEQERQDMLGAIIALRSNAESNGAPIRIGGEVYRFGISNSNRIDFQDIARRAQNNINDGKLDAITRTYDIDGNSFKLYPASALALADAVLEQYAAIWNAASELRDLVLSATVETGLPVLPQVIEIDARDVD